MQPQPRTISVGNIYGTIKGIPSSTTCTVYIAGQHTLYLTKTSGTDNWYYNTEVRAGEYDVTATDTTSGAGGNNQTNYDVVILGDQYVVCNFDIS